jgi:hypothetical protein
MELSERERISLGMKRTSGVYPDTKMMTAVNMMIAASRYVAPHYTTRHYIPGCSIVIARAGRRVGGKEVRRKRSKEGGV